jgi:hypothetical protein
MASKTAKIDLEIRVDPNPIETLDKLKNDLNNMLTKAGINTKVISVKDSFYNTNTDDIIENYYITILFDPEFKLEKNIKKQLNIVILNYLKERYSNRVYKKDVSPAADKLQLYVDNLDKCTKIMYHYGFSLTESVSKLLKFVKNNDVKNGNKQLSKILREKIDNRLSKSLKK